jgi:hypothetical protein
MFKRLILIGILILLVFGSCSKLTVLDKKKEAYISENWKKFDNLKEEYLIDKYKENGIELKKDKKNNEMGKGLNKYQIKYCKNDSVNTVEYVVLDGTIKESRIIEMTSETLVYDYWSNITIIAKILIIIVIIILVILLFKSGIIDAF